MVPGELEERAICERNSGSQVGETGLASNINTMLHKSFNLPNNRAEHRIKCKEAASTAELRHTGIGWVRKLSVVFHCLLYVTPDAITPDRLPGFRRLRICGKGG